MTSEHGEHGEHSEWGGRQNPRLPTAGRESHAQGSTGASGAPNTRSGNDRQGADGADVVRSSGALRGRHVRDSRRTHPETRVKEGVLNELYNQFDSVFFERTRLSILTVLYQEERASFKALKRRLVVTDGALYTHLEKLIDASYVDKRKELVGSGAETVYRLTEEGRNEFRNYVSFLESMLGNLE